MPTNINHAPPSTDDLEDLLDGQHPITVAELLQFWSNAASHEGHSFHAEDDGTYYLLDANGSKLDTWPDLDALEHTSYRRWFRYTNEYLVRS
jgi:hypothetical protein